MSRIQKGISKYRNLKLIFVKRDFQFQNILVSYFILELKNLNSPREKVNISKHGILLEDLKRVFS